MCFDGGADKAKRSNAPPCVPCFAGLDPGLVSGLRVREFTGPLASGASCDGADRRARGHPDRTASSADRGTRGRTTAGTDALGEVMMGQLVFRLGIGDLCCSLARQTACCGADDG